MIEFPVFATRLHVLFKFSYYRIFESWSLLWNSFEYFILICLLPLYVLLGVYLYRIVLRYSINIIQRWHKMARTFDLSKFNHDSMRFELSRFTCTGKKSRLIFANFVTLKHCWQCANITFFNQIFYSDTQQSLLWRDSLTGWTRRSGSTSLTQHSHLWRESLTRWTG